MDRSIKIAIPAKVQGAGQRSSDPRVATTFKRRLVDRRIAVALDALDAQDPEYFRRAFHHVTFEMKSLLDSLYGKPTVPASPNAVAELYGTIDDIEAARAGAPIQRSAEEDSIAHAASESPYPDEYVVLLGARVVFHSLDQLEALKRYAELLRAEGQAPPTFLPPRAVPEEEKEADEEEREPQIRGRAVVDELWWRR